MLRARSTRFPRVVLSLAAACAVWVFTTTATFGQSTTATVRGTVEDSGGGVVPGANVTMTNTGTRGVQTTVSDERGHTSSRACSPAPTT